jgi:putative N-acetylmannosamine-6-phosphate epimerase
MASAVERTLGGLIVSCQPVIGGPLDRPDIIIGFALAAEAGGAAGLRIEGIANVRSVRAVTELPIIGIVKRMELDTSVMITSRLDDVLALTDAGADIIAFDATDRARPVPVAELAAAVRGAGLQSMADCASFADARSAAALGIDVIGTTLAGYTGGPVPWSPDLELVRKSATLGRPVFAEGRYRNVEDVREARLAGADAVVVGSAITRPEHITGWFAEAVHLPAPADPVRS